MLSSSTGKRSKEINKSLAKDIVKNNDTKSVKELIMLLENIDKNIQSDSIEVLYETGYIKPDLIAEYHEIFTELLKSKNNRLVWGAMIALSSISKIVPEIIFNALPRIRKAVDTGSVITKDAGVVVYANLSIIKSQKNDVLPLILDELEKCPDKQLAQYVEKSLVAIDSESKEAFLRIINSRMQSLEKESQIQRVKRILRKVEKA
jgi:hypothetical protein